MNKITNGSVILKISGQKLSNIDFIFLQKLKKVQAQMEGVVGTELKLMQN